MAFLFLAVLPLAAAVQTPAYLILADSQFVGSQPLQALVDFRQSSGANVTVVNVDSIGSTQMQIKSFIHEFDSLVSPSPLSVLLVGATSRIPMYTFWYGNHSSDMYYGCTDGDSDLVIDATVGRLPARNASELSGMVGKIVSYESDTSGHWRDTALLVGSQPISGYPSFRPMLSVVKNSINPTGWAMAFVEGYGDVPGASGLALYNFINAGTGLVVYNGNGTQDSWLNWSADTAYPSYLSWYAASQTNGTRAPIVLSCAPYTAVPDTNSSLSDAFLQNVNGGAAAFFRATGYVVQGLDSIYNMSHFVSEGLYTYGLPLGKAHQYALYRMNLAFESDTNLNILDDITMYTLAGDPNTRVPHTTAHNHINSLVWFVPHGGSIQHAIDSCGDGAVIWVDSGTYLHFMNCDEQFTTTGKILDIRSIYGPQKTFIDGRDSITAVRSRSLDFVLDGFTVMHGHGDHSITGGGGIATNGTTVITRCIIRNNRSPYCAGGIELHNGGYYTIENCLFAFNSYQEDGTGTSQIHGAGIGLDCTSLTPTITNCDFICNDGAIDDAAMEGERNCIHYGNHYGGSYYDDTLFHFYNLTGSSPFESFDTSATRGYLGTLSGSLRLKKDSPLINAGKNNLLPPSCYFDLDNNPRIHIKNALTGGTVDVGCYESQY
jgi:hypothetical protein